MRTYIHTHTHTYIHTYIHTYRYGDCGSTASWLFFLCFKIVCEYIMLNLFVGMILDNFSFITDEVGVAALRAQLCVSCVACCVLCVVRVPAIMVIFSIFVLIIYEVHIMHVCIYTHINTFDSRSKAVAENTCMPSLSLPLLVVCSSVSACVYVLMIYIRIRDHDHVHTHNCAADRTCGGPRMVSRSQHQPDQGADGVLQEFRLRYGAFAHILFARLHVYYQGS